MIGEADSAASPVSLVGVGEEQRGAVLGNDELTDGPPQVRTEATFVDYVASAEPRLRKALVALNGTERGHDATAGALA